MRKNLRRRPDLRFGSGGGGGDGGVMSVETGDLGNGAVGAMEPASREGGMDVGGAV